MSSPGSRGRGSRLARVLLIAFAALACVLLAGGLTVRHALLASLPLLDGTRRLPGLAARVRVERDALGIPTVRGGNRRDVARATGFVHAQDRFFQMDVARRLAAGELSELFGRSTLPNDRKYRIHRLRAVAREVIARARPGEREVLTAYAEGVNAGLQALGARPPEYLMLRAGPASWRPEDSVLIVGAMFGNDLENSRREVELGRMYARLPAALVDFLRPLGDEWDAPMLGGPILPPPIPPASIFHVSAGPPAAHGPRMGSPRLFSDQFLREAGGSNAWAIDAAHAADGRALVATDPHLPLHVPNIWYRLSLEWRDDQAVEHRVTGASLPGLPFVAIGSNRHIAWGFTVAFDDRSDMVIVEPNAAKRDEYRTPPGFRKFETATEWIKVRGAKDERLDIVSTMWGPVVPVGLPGVVAQEWQAHHPDGMNLTFSEMENAIDVAQALDVANRSGMPSYNIVVADEGGSIGWTVTGRLPRRVGFDGRVPTSWADGTRRWDGWLEPGEYPRIVNPPSGRVWTSNNRLVDRPLLDRLGLEGYIMGPRARQVRDDLMANEKSTPQDSLRIQLDDRALFLDRWRAFLLDTLSGNVVGESPARREFRRLLEQSWDGRASANSVGYLLVRDCRFELARRVIYPLAQPGDDHAFRPGAIIEWWESALWRLVHDRPPHLLRPGGDWNQAILAAVDATIGEATRGGRSLSAATWGTTTEPITHLLSPAVPWLAPWLDMPYEQLPGDANLPRVRMPGPGAPVTATLRMVVAPGHEEAGIFHMPTGQSGHPLSPHYRDMQASWVEGRPTPFLPGRTVHTLILEKR